jgi:hypothetical protein
MAEQDGSPDDIGLPVPSPREGGAASQPDPDEQTDIGTSILLNLDILSGLSDSARIHYKECIKKFASALAREASRLEEADRAEEADKPEITTTMVVKANDLLRRPPSNDATSSISTVLAQTASFGLGIMTPIIFGAGLPSPWQWTTTIICGILAVICQTYAIVVVRRR